MDWRNIKHGGTRVYLAGAESCLETLSEVGVKYILVSYFYLSKMDKKKIDKFFDTVKNNKMHVMIDSGAHTIQINYWYLYPFGAKWVEMFQSKVDNLTVENHKKLREEYYNNKEEHLANLELYNKKYREWILERQDIPMVFAEVDIQHIVGEDVSERWRKEWKETGLQNRTILTMHSIEENRIEEESQKIIQKIKAGWTFFGIAGWIEKDFYTFFNTNSDLLKAGKVKFHGWAETKIEKINRLPLFSCDSSSWLSGARFGTTYDWQGTLKGGLKTIHDKKDRDKLFLRAADEGINIEDFKADKYFAVNKWNASQWREFQKFHYLKLDHAYWLSDEEKEITENILREENSLGNVLPRHGIIAVKPSQDKRTLQNLPRFCDTCVIKERCPHAEKGTTCSLVSSIKLDSMTDIKEATFEILKLQLDRILHGLYVERVQGGNPDERNNEQINQFFSILNQMKKLGAKPQDELTIKAKGTGIIQKIFGGGKSQKGHGSTNVQRISREFEEIDAEEDA